MAHGRDSPHVKLLGQQELVQWKPADIDPCSLISGPLKPDIHTHTLVRVGVHGVETPRARWEALLL